MIKRTHPLVETIPNQPVQTAAAINEQLLRALEELNSTFEMFVQGITVPEESVVGRNIADAKAAIAAAKAVKRSQQVPVNEQMLRTLKIIRGKHACGALTLPKGDFEQVDEAIVAAEAAKKGGGDGYMGKAR